MEHAASTLIREPDLESLVDPLPDSSGTPGRSDRHPVQTSAKRSGWTRLVTEGRVVFLLAFGLYFAVAWLLDIKYAAFNQDSISRMANGFYVLYSRDPHLAAVGFVWNPLQSVADLVFLLGNHLWPALSHNDMAGSLVSALAMAGAAYQILATLREWGVTRVPRLVLTALFVVDPMIILYGGNGMSEALYLFTLVASARYLMRWIHRGDLRSLAYAAIMLGVGYLARNEAAAAVMAGAVTVAALSYRRAEGRPMARMRTAMGDSLIFAVPGFTAAVGWAVASFVITGQAFGQFTSQYGNSAELHSEATSSFYHRTFATRAMFEVHAIDVLAPLLLIVLLTSVAVAIWKRDPRVLAPLAVVGGAMAFDMLSYLDNKVFPWLRFYIPAIPLEVLLVGSLIAALQVPRKVPTPVPTTPRLGSIVRAMVGAGLALVVMIPAFRTTASAMLNADIGSNEDGEIGFIFRTHPSSLELASKNFYPHILSIDHYLSALHLPPGDVLVDNGTPCIPAVITSSNQPKLFVIPNDRDFQRTLADPITFHARYILELDPSFGGYQATDAQYPSLWNTGSGFSKLVHKFPAGGSCVEMRLFHVLSHSNPVGIR